MHEINYWHEKWKTNDIAFHQSEFNRHLVQFFKYPTGKVFVPLCGKTKDMYWLEAQGHEVVGAELSELACQSFFEEAKRPFTKEARGKLTGFRSGKTTLWCGDYFELTPEHLAGTNLFYDRAALIALPEPVRQRYVKHLVNLFPRGKSLDGLLIIVNYPNDTIQGPPFSIEESEIHQLYGSRFHVEKLKSAEVPKEKRIQKLAGAGHLIETIYSIRS